jgi:ATP-dependent Clp protease adaptor protein ClpS
MGKIKDKIDVNEKIEEELKAIFSGDVPWVTIVWDDPVNLMTYVTYVLMELFGFRKEKAHELMMKVHTEGKAVVSTGSREEMEHDVARLLEYGLLATLQRGDQAL